MRADQERTRTADITYANLGSQGINLQLVGITRASLVQVRDVRLSAADGLAPWL